MRNFLGIIIAGIFLVCGFSLLAETVTTYEVLPGNTTVRVNITNTHSEIWTLEEVLFHTRSAEADRVSLAASQESMNDAYNISKSNKDADIDDLNAVLENMVIPVKE